jgi:histidine triad (HIT) family protein
MTGKICHCERSEAISMTSGQSDATHVTKGERAMAADPNCIFCRIVAGDVPCFKLYEDANTLAFMDINPAHGGHCLVIPKAHFPNIFDIAPEAIAAAARTAAFVAKAVSAAVQPDGLSVMQANGSGAGQSVGHFHFHLIPRRLGDQLLFNWEPKPGDMAHIAELADRIRAQL